MIHSGSVLSDAAHSFAAKLAGGKDAPNQERSRTNPTGTVATLFLGRAELGAATAPLQMMLKLQSGVSPLSPPLIIIGGWTR